MVEALIRQCCALFFIVLAAEAVGLALAARVAPGGIGALVALPLPVQGCLAAFVAYVVASLIPALHLAWRL